MDNRGKTIGNIVSDTLTFMDDMGLSMAASDNPHLWRKIYSWSCSELPPRGISVNLPQWTSRYNCRPLDRSASQHWYGTLPATRHRRAVNAQNSEQRRWSKIGHHSRGETGNAFFDVRVFNSFVQSHRNTPSAQCYRWNEMERRRQYDERVREIEQGSFSPLVFYHIRQHGNHCNHCIQENCSNDRLKSIASPTAELCRCRLSFSLLRSAIMCLWGSRSALHRPAGMLITTDTMDLACSEGS